MVGLKVNVYRCEFCGFKTTLRKRIREHIRQTYKNEVSTPGETVQHQWKTATKGDNPPLKENYSKRVEDR